MSSSSRSSSGSNSATAVSLWFGKSSSNHSDLFSVSAWAALDESSSSDNNNNNNNDQKKKKLLYASLEDLQSSSSPQLPVVTTWLQKWQPQVIHIGCATAPSKVLLQWLDGLEAQLAEPSTTDGATSGENDNDNNNDNNSGNGAAAAAAPNAKIVVHADLPKNAHKQAPKILRQLVEGNKAATYALSGNVDLANNGPLLQGLALLLQGLGLWTSSSALLDGQHHNHHGNYMVMPDATAAVPFLLLDRTAAASMHVWPIQHQGEADYQGKCPAKDSLWGIVSKDCLTSMGKRLMKHWLRQPLTHLVALKKRQAAVAFLVDSGVGRDSLRSQGLRPMQLDLGKLAQQLAKYGDDYEAGGGNDDNNDDDDDAGGESTTAMGSTRKALQALYHLYLVASQKVPLLTQELVELLAQAPQPADDDSEQQPPEILKELCTGMQQVAAQIELSVELAEAVLDLDRAPRDFMVKASYKAELGEIQQEIDKIMEEVEEHHAEMNDTWARVAGLATGGGGGNNNNAVRLETDSGTSEWQFRLPDTNCSKILQKQLGSTVTVHRILKNGVYFSTKRLRELSCARQQLGTEFDRQQRVVVLDAMKVAATYHLILEKASEYVAQLDALASLAHLAAYNSQGYCRPILTDGEENGMGIQLKGARHPCVELQENVEFIPNDVDLVFGESSFKIVTGPNMGGKSTYIRALGAIVVLAQIGSYVPCTSAKINLCHHILARVGAGDLQDRGISTFMAEMIESATMLNLSTKRSLIIIDELGRGTSTFDGYGLARAISEYIVQDIGCMTVFATHFHELTALEEQESVVKNCHVTAHKGNQGLTFLYEVNPGPCLESFGIQVAEMANVPKVVVQDAKRKAKELENFEYRKKRQDAAADVANNATEDSDAAANDDEANEHTSAEDAAASIACMNKCRNLDLESIVLSKCNNTDAEKRAALLAALE